MREELLQKMLYERISLLHGEPFTPQEKDIINAGEQVIKEMEKEERTKIEAYLNLLTDKDTDAETRAYTEGFKDAVWLMERLYKIKEEHK